MTHTLLMCHIPLHLFLAHCYGTFLRGSDRVEVVVKRGRGRRKIPTELLRNAA